MWCVIAVSGKRFVCCALIAYYIYSTYNMVGRSIASLFDLYVTSGLIYIGYTSPYHTICITNCTSLFVKNVIIASIHLAKQVLFCILYISVVYYYYTVLLYSTTIQYYHTYTYGRSVFSLFIWPQQYMSPLVWCIGYTPPYHTIIIYITNCTSVFVESVMIASIHLAEQVLFVHYYGHTVYKTISNVYI